MKRGGSGFYLGAGLGCLWLALRVAPAGRRGAFYEAPRYHRRVKAITIYHASCHTAAGEASLLFPHVAADTREEEASDEEKKRKGRARMKRSANFRGSISHCQRLRGSEGIRFGASGIVPLVSRGMRRWPMAARARGTRMRAPPPPPPPGHPPALGLISPQEVSPLSPRARRRPAGWLACCPLSVALLAIRKRWLTSLLSPLQEKGLDPRHGFASAGERPRRVEGEEVMHFDVKPA